MNRRFYCAAIPSVGEDATLEQSESYHLCKVLRAEIGDNVFLMDGKGVLAEARIRSIPSKPQRSTVACLILSRTAHAPPLNWCSLYISPPKSKVMSQIVRRSVELGIP